MEDPAGGPNFWLFDPNARYELNIDNNGNGKPDITYRFRFRTIVRNPSTFLYNTGQVTTANDADQNVIQSYSVTRVKNGHSTRLGSDIPVAPANVGPRSDPSGAPTAGAIKNLGGGDQRLRRPARRPLLRRSRVDLRPGRPAPVQRLPCHPRHRRGGRRRPEGPQRPVDRDPGADHGPDPRRQGSRRRKQARDRRDLDERLARRPRRSSRTASSAPPVRGCRSRDWATRSSTRSSSRAAGRTTGTRASRTATTCS